MAHIVKLILITSLFLFGCRHLSPSQITEEQLNEVVTTARDIILKHHPELDEESKRMIRNNLPHYGYYLLSGYYADYDFTWKITNKRIVVLSGRGNLLTLENAKSRILPLEQNR